MLVTLWDLTCFSVSVIQIPVCLFVSEQKKKKERKKLFFFYETQIMTSIWVICISMTSVYHQFTFSSATPGLWSSISVFSEAPWAQVTHVLHQPRGFPGPQRAATASLLICSKVPPAGLFSGPYFWVFSIWCSIPTDTLSTMYNFLLKQ